MSRIESSIDPILAKPTIPVEEPRPRKVPKIPDPLPHKTPKPVEPISPPRQPVPVGR